MRASKVNSADLLSGGFRLDASFHANEGSNAFNLLHMWKSRNSLIRQLDTIGNVCLRDGIFIGGRAKRIYVDDPKYGIPFLSSSDMLLASLDGVKLISKKQPGVDSLLLQPGWTLISRSGTIGNTTYVRSDMDGLAGSEHIMRVVADKKKILPGYLYAFLSSAIGVSIIRQGTFGAVIDTIEPKYIASMPIPRLQKGDEEHIHQLIDNAAQLRVEANKYLHQAQETLDTCIYRNYQHIMVSHRLASTALKVEVLHSDSIYSSDFRLDASYHASIGQKTIRELIETGTKLERLEQVCLPRGIFIPGRFKRIYVDGPQFGAPYLTGNSISKTKPLYGAKFLSFKQIANKDELLLRDKMILITCSGIIGNSAYVNSNFWGAVGSPDLIRILADSHKIKSGYLYAYLRSPLAKVLIQQRTYGAVVPHIEAHHIFDLPVPRLEGGQETLIHQLIEKASELQEKANEIEDQAQSHLNASLGLSN